MMRNQRKHKQVRFVLDYDNVLYFEHRMYNPLGCNSWGTKGQSKWECGQNGNTFHLTSFWALRPCEVDTW